MPRPVSRRPQHDRWLVSYADFTTLLFAFFVAVYAVTLADTAQLGTLADGITGTPATQRESDAIRHELEGMLETEVATDQVDLRDDPRGVVLAVPVSHAFADGDAVMSEQAEAMFRQIGKALARLPNAVRIEGHTDNRPIVTEQYPSNWELSTARATAVVAFLVEEGFVAPDRLSVAGYAEHRPVADNETPEGRAANRRVDIVVVGRQVAAAQEPALPRP
jgi:chemotaxis protein MotB